MTSIVNQAAFLKTSRNFPKDAHQMTVEMNKTYVDIANSVNIRTIGLFPTSKPALNGEEWFLTGNAKQQGLRQVYPFVGPLAANPFTIPHGINTADISQFTRIYGTFFATGGGSSFYYPLPYVDNFSSTNQVSLYVGITKIFIAIGAGFTPTIQSGVVVLEWIGDP